MIQIDRELPKSCEDCTFRFNRVSTSWRCGALNGYSVNTRVYNSDKIRPQFCPLKEQEELKAKIKTLGEEMRITQKSITDDKVLIGFNMALALCNKHIGGIEE